MPVQVIEAIPQYSTAPDAPPRKLRCAYYARISLDEDGTSTSIAGQRAYFEDYIKNNPEYIFSGAYYDDGISGTSTRKRHSFNQMLRDVEENKLDVILVKSISRWGRNIVLTLSSLRLCAEHNCRVYFFKEGLWSDDPATNLILTIMSSMAEAESSSTSLNVSLGIRFAFQQGKPMINCTRFLGYDKDPVSKKLVINPTEARTVRFIYRAFLEGFSIPEIAKKLTDAHIPTVSGKSNWSTDTIRYILSNEKYCGDLLMQKTYCPSFLTHKMVKNDGKLPQYYVADNHDPVIPRDVWNAVQGALVSRGKTEGHPGQRRYALSGKVICGCCGTEYKRFAGRKQAVASPVDPFPADNISNPATVGSAAPVTPSTSSVVESEARSAAPAQVNTVVAAGGGAAVWKCKARVSAKDAARARQRLGSTSATSNYSTLSAPTSPGEGGGEAGDVMTVWRCQSPIIPEEKLQMAVDRALALLPREIENIRLIREECERVLAAPASRAAGISSPSPSPVCGSHSGMGSGVGEAQILLLHTETALKWLAHASTLTSGGGGTSGAGKDGLPCTTFQQFVERSRVWLGSVEKRSEAIGLLIDKVVVDGEKIKVRFKAGVEI